MVQITRFPDCHCAEASADGPLGGLRRTVLLELMIPLRVMSSFSSWAVIRGGDLSIQVSS